VLKPVLIAESSGPWGGIGGNINQGAYNYVNFGGEKEGQYVIIRVIQVYLIVGLEERKGFALQQSKRVRQDNQNFEKQVFDAF
jgi:hypothetical protein